jgi:hypothetical protein
VTVDEAQKPRPIFWPALFGAAFLVGALLWCVWMWHIVQKTREARDNSFFVPVTGQTAPSANNPPAPPTNSNATNVR